VQSLRRANSGASSKSITLASRSSERIRPAPLEDDLRLFVENEAKRRRSVFVQPPTVEKPGESAYSHVCDVQMRNLRKQKEKLCDYTNLTRLKPFVNLQLDPDALHSCSPFLFELGNERTCF
jgi:hypothetical protein